MRPCERATAGRHRKRKRWSWAVCAVAALAREACARDAPFLCNRNACEWRAAADAGGELVVQGTVKLKGSIEIREATLRIVGGGEHGRSALEIDGGEESILRISSKSDVYVENVTFYGGRSQFGGAVFVDSTSRLTAENVSFLNNSASLYGGAVYSTFGAVVSINNCNFENNAAVRGGAVYFGPSTTQSISSLDFSGSAVELMSPVLRTIISKSTFAKNVAQERGGAIYSRSSGQIIVSESQFVSNRALIAGQSGDIGKGTDQTELSVLLLETKFISNHPEIDGQLLPCKSHRRLIRKFCTKIPSHLYKSRFETNPGCSCACALESRCGENDQTIQIPEEEILSGTQCFIPEGNTGWQRSHSECQIPFSYRNEDGSWTEFDYPPALNEAQPYGLQLLGLNRDDSFSRWCPKLGVHEYDAFSTNDEDLDIKAWGLVTCNSSCFIPPEGPGWIKQSSECQLPFSFKNTDGTWSTFHSPPSIEDAEPFGVQELEISLKSGLRWCPKMGLKRYNPRNLNDQKLWGTVHCHKPVTTASDRSPSASTCTIDGGYSNAPGTYCKFPFTFNGTEYHSCADFANNPPYVNPFKLPLPPVQNLFLPMRDARWCALDNYYDTSDVRKQNRWGFCNPLSCNICTSNSGTPCLSLNEVQSTLVRNFTAINEFCFIQDQLDSTPHCIEQSTLKAVPCHPSSCSIPSHLSEAHQEGEARISSPITRRQLKAACKTDGGYVSSGSQCKFPFKIDGDWHFSCIPLDKFQPFTSKLLPPKKPITLTQPTSWCPIVPKYSASKKKVKRKWGYCSHTCDDVDSGKPEIGRTVEGKSVTGVASISIQGEYTKSGSHIVFSLSYSSDVSFPPNGLLLAKWFPCSNFFQDSQIDGLICAWGANEHTVLWMKAPLHRPIRQLRANLKAFLGTDATEFTSVQIGVPDNLYNVEPSLLTADIVGFCNDTKPIVLLDASPSWNLFLVESVAFLVRLEDGATAVPVNNCTMTARPGSSLDPSAFRCNLDVDAQFSGSEIKKFQASVKMKNIFGGEGQSIWRTISLAIGANLSFSRVLGPEGPLKLYPNTEIFLRADLELGPSCHLKTPTIIMEWDTPENDLSIDVLAQQTAKVSFAVPIRKETLSKPISTYSSAQLSAVVEKEGRPTLQTVGTISWPISVEQQSPTVHFIGANKTLVAGAYFNISPLGKVLAETSPALWRCVPLKVCREFSMGFYSSDAWQLGQWTEEVSADALLGSSHFPSLQVLTATFKSSSIGVGETVEVFFYWKPDQSDISLDWSQPVKITLLNPPDLSALTSEPTFNADLPDIVSWSSAINTGTLFQIVGSCSQEGDVDFLDFPSFTFRSRSNSQELSFNASYMEELASTVDQSSRYWVLSANPELILNNLFIFTRGDEYLDIDFSCGSSIQKASISLPILQAPTRGTVVVEPDFGYTGETSFTVAAWNWNADVKQSLQYFYELTYNAEGNSNFPMEVITGLYLSSSPSNVILPYTIPGERFTIQVRGFARDTAMNIGVSDQVTEFKVETRLWEGALLSEKYQQSLDWVRRSASLDTLHSFELAANDLRGLLLSSQGDKNWHAVVCGAQVVFLTRLYEFVYFAWETSSDRIFFSRRLLSLLEYIAFSPSICIAAYRALIVAFRQVSEFLVHPLPSTMSDLRMLSLSHLWPTSLKESMFKAATRILTNAAKLKKLNSEELTLSCGALVQNEDGAFHSWKAALMKFSCSNQPQSALSSAKFISNLNSGTLNFLRSALDTALVTSNSTSLSIDNKFACTIWRQPRHSFRHQVPFQSMGVLLNLASDHAKPLMSDSSSLFDIVQVEVCRYERLWEWGISDDLIHKSFLVSDVVSVRAGMWPEPVARISLPFAVNLKLKTSVSVSSRIENFTSVTISAEDGEEITLYCQVSSFDALSKVVGNCSVSIAQSLMAPISEIVCLCNTEGLVSAWMSTGVDIDVLPKPLLPNAQRPMLVILAVLSCVIWLLILIGYQRDKIDHARRAKGIYMLLARRSFEGRKMLQSGMDAFQMLFENQIHLRRFPTDEGLSRSEGGCSKSNLPLLSETKKGFDSVFVRRVLNSYHLLLLQCQPYDPRFKRITRSAMLCLSLLANLGVCVALFASRFASQGVIYLYLAVPALCIFPFMVWLRIILENLPAYSTIPKRLSHGLQQRLDNRLKKHTELLENARSARDSFFQENGLSMDFASHSEEMASSISPIIHHALVLEALYNSATDRLARTEQLIETEQFRRKSRELFLVLLAVQHNLSVCGSLHVYLKDDNRKCIPVSSSWLLNALQSLPKLRGGSMDFSKATLFNRVYRNRFPWRERIAWGLFWCLMVSTFFGSWGLYLTLASGLSEARGWQLAYFFLGSIILDLFFIQPILLALSSQCLGRVLEELHQECGLVQGHLRQDSQPNACPSRDPALRFVADIFLDRNAQLKKAKSSSWREEKSVIAPNQELLLHTPDESDIESPFLGLLEESDESQGHSSNEKAKFSWTNWSPRQNIDDVLFPVRRSRPSHASYATDEDSLSFAETSSTVSSYARVPHHLWEQESESFKSKLRDLMMKESKSGKDVNRVRSFSPESSTSGEDSPPLRSSFHSSPAPSSKFREGEGGCSVAIVDLTDLELESDF